MLATDLRLAGQSGSAGNWWQALEAYCCRLDSTTPPPAVTATVQICAEQGALSVVSCILIDWQITHQLHCLLTNSKHCLGVNASLATSYHA